MNRIVTLVLIALITVFVIHILNVNAEGARADLTESELYSLTEGSQDILTKMKQEGVKPIDIKLYFSMTAGKSLPQFIKNFITYNRYIRNLLKEYARYSDGKIRLSYIDPLPDSDEAQDGIDYGLEGKVINQYGDQFFFGLVFETQTGSKDTIEFLWPEKQEAIEYEISKRIYNLLWPKKRHIAILSGIDPLPDNNPYMAQLLAAQGKQAPEPWISMQVLQETYDVSRLDKDGDTISPEDYDLLLVIHPKGFGDKTLWAINEWVVTGGATIVFLDPFSIVDQAPSSPQQPWAQLQYEPSSNLDKLLGAWGVTREDSKFAVDYELAVKRPYDRSGGAERIITDLMISDKTASTTLDQGSPIFQGLADIRFYLAGVLRKKDDAPAEITPLITTTDAGSTLTIKPGFGGSGELAYTDLNNPPKLLDNYTPGDKKLALAYLIQGKLPSAFPEGATFPKETPQTPPGMPPGFQMPPDENAEMITKEPLSEDRLSETRVLVFADVDFITDQLAFQNSLFGVQAVNDNYKVLLNSVDYLLGAEELMKVRSKRRIRRPFTLFDRIEARADERVLDQERQIRADIERFQQEVQEMQRGMNQKNAVLLQKKVRDDITRLNEKIGEGNRKLREIKKQKRAVLAKEEAFVSISIIAFMPVLVCIGGLVAYYRGRNRKIPVKESRA